MTSGMNCFNPAVTVDEYLAETNVLFYLSDALAQLLEHKEEYTNVGVTRYFAEYFSSVKNSNHILFREFNYIRATPHNRASFIRVFWRCYRQIGMSGDMLSMLEYSSLLQLLCPDFPVEIVKSAARIALMNEGANCLMSFSDFLYAFQLQFYYQEFLDSVQLIYQDLLAGKSPNTVIVPTSASVEQIPCLALEEKRDLEIEASTLAGCIDALCDRFRHSHPPRSCLKDALEESGKVAYDSLLRSLAKHEVINQTIGALPSKTEVLIDQDLDHELDKLIAQISVSPSSNSSGSAVGMLKEVQRKASPRRNIHHRRKMEVESDGSTEETDSSEN
ncbi:centriolar satellite-associated tubulin polyglutamylase complex regulator 1 [Nerophis ophidion]|uniref:centriolar satellite-associated tubulin polyglutamylase complex regulator 1 n=1 Tax=Nerophis ophidion TaxID=159077 RepID=UPI002ADF5B80|nr:centriolar satellite-associated tubulin polyglutamylase complex regulator 1 [Nerophis ophidion]XP_061773350.1 centriolar satellite-associated tubulin polyglutamylase complex regulator 1 [Nerophis ophidion]